MSHTTHDTKPHLAGDTEDPADGPTWLVAVASCILIAVTVLACIALYYGAERREKQHKVTSVRTQEWDLVRQARINALMVEPHWEQWTEADGELAGERKLVVPIGVARDVVKSRWAAGGPGHPVEQEDAGAADGDHGGGH